MTKRSGRDAFAEIARFGRQLYSHGIDERIHHVLVSDGRTRLLSAMRSSPTVTTGT